MACLEEVADRDEPMEDEKGFKNFVATKTALNGIEINLKIKIGADFLEDYILFLRTNIDRWTITF